MKSLAIVICSIVFAIHSSAQMPIAVAGIIKRHENFQSKYITSRNIDVWLPQGYSSIKKYAVLYMHDGQMLFDSAITWNKQSWNVDDVLTNLIATNKIKDVIVVGIWNDGKSRHADYFPQNPFESLTQAEKDSVYKSVRTNGAAIFNNYKIHSDDYLKFLVTELKPFIDSAYSVYTNASNTFIAGSSMGGLISLYAICEYPKIFGAAACLSTHWPGIFSMENNPIPAAFFSYLKMHLPNPNNHRIYFDYGNQTLDAMYPPLQKQVDTIMKLKGFNNTNWQTKFFSGENHSEIAWNKRLHIPLLFLLKQ